MILLYLTLVAIVEVCEQNVGAWKPVATQVRSEQADE